MSWSYALSPYILHPETFDENIVIYFDDKATIITDQFNKSEYHLLILPRDPELTKKHPSIAINIELKNNILQKYIIWCQNYIYESFVGKFEILTNDLTDKNSFINNFIKVGVHSAPSMKNLHIHVITKDFHSMKLKNKKHYNSFNTSFFIEYDQLPLDTIPDKEEIEDNAIKKSDLICSYCHKNFGNKFSQLKKHLDIEFNDHFKIKEAE
ncbi:DNA 5'-adenosine monophosphate hydrolase PWA37_001639 [Arxiozyma heterogenica]|uniref:Aprataxin C2HE/C2H2/C2HC zinc finger domain-containing protein n=1 Tax=Arxiozyma heterogenica TaxID=278026 RepID=A0AAN8A742_9SACH|nr:hypothetical protein RI543_002527 [Kazachstania heterogenica]